MTISDVSELTRSAERGGTLSSTASDDRKISRLAHHLIRECAPLEDLHYKSLVEVLDLEVKSKSPTRRAVALRTLARVIKEKVTNSTSRRGKPPSLLLKRQAPRRR